MICSVFLMSLTMNCIFAQDNSDSSKTVVKKDTIIENTFPLKPTHGEEIILDTTAFKLNEVKFIGYPYVFYTPETQLAFGIGGMVYFRTALQASQKPSKITVSGYYTTNSQYQLSVKPRIYFPGLSRFYLESDFYISYDVLKFYGVGNYSPEIDSVNYKSSSFGIRVETQTRGLLFKFLQIGLIYDYVNLKMQDKMHNPNLLDSTLPGYSGGKIAGLGLGWTFDYRDNISFPSRGGLYRISGTFYGKDLGGDFTYNRYLVDLRHYVAFFGDHVLAFQFYSDLNSGRPPFFKMPALGGSERMRGFFEGRYRDEDYITAQIEYRKIVWWRIGLTVFYATGEVFSDFDQLKMTGLNHSYGFGLRFVFDPKEKINLRVDFGKTEGSSGIYFGMDEAF